MSYTHTTTVPLSYADAVELTKQVLSEQGFGVLSEIDVRSTFETMVELSGTDAVREVASDADTRLRAALAQLPAAAGAQ